MLKVPSRHWMTSRIKKVVYGKRGEPIRYGDIRLRFEPGTRPVRLRYRNDTNANVRNDVRQIEFMLEKLRMGDTFVDIGAHAGQYSVLAAALVGDSGSVTAFEPDPAANSLLHRNLALNSCQHIVRVEQIAVSDTSSETSTFFSKNGNSQSSLARSAVDFSGSIDPSISVISVATESLDDYWTRNQLPTPHVAKIDVEGAEVNVLRGALNLLASNCLILCELHPYAWAEFGVEYDDISKLVAQYDRKISFLDERLDLKDGPQYGTVLIA